VLLPHSGANTALTSPPRSLTRPPHCHRHHHHHHYFRWLWLQGKPWSNVWTYRRIHAVNGSSITQVVQGEISNQVRTRVWGTMGCDAT